MDIHDSSLCQLVSIEAAVEIIDEKVGIGEIVEDVGGVDVDVGVVVEEVVVVVEEVVVVVVVVVDDDVEVVGVAVVGNGVRVTVVEAIVVALALTLIRRRGGVRLLSLRLLRRLVLLRLLLLVLGCRSLVASQGKLVVGEDKQFRLSMHQRHLVGATTIDHKDEALCSLILVAGVEDLVVAAGDADLEVRGGTTHISLAILQQRNVLEIAPFQQPRHSWAAPVLEDTQQEKTVANRTVGGIHHLHTHPSIWAEFTRHHDSHNGRRDLHDWELLSFHCLLLSCLV